MQTAAWLDLINNSDYNGSNDNREGDMRQSWWETLAGICPFMWQHTAERWQEAGARDEARHVTQICHSDQNFRPLILQDDRSTSHKKISCGIFLSLCTPYWGNNEQMDTLKVKNNTKNRENYLPSINIESSFFTNLSRMCWNLEKPPNQS